MALATVLTACFFAASSFFYTSLASFFFYSRYACAWAFTSSYSAFTFGFVATFSFYASFGLKSLARIFSSNSSISLSFFFLLRRFLNNSSSNGPCALATSTSASVKGLAWPFLPPSFAVFFFGWVVLYILQCLSQNFNKFIL